MQNLGFLPEWIVAGETIWIAAANTAQSGEDIILDDTYLPETHTLAYDFAGTTPTTITAAANTGGTGWTLEVSATETVTWRGGAVAFRGKVTDKTTGRVTTVDVGEIQVKASPLTVSQYAAALAAVEAAIAEYAANPYGSFTVPGGMTVNYRSMDELLALRSFYRAEVARETATRPRRVILGEYRCR
jgi:hypothetical protein